MGIWSICSDFVLQTTECIVFYSIFSYATFILDKVSKIVWVFESLFIKNHFVVEQSNIILNINDLW